jgi:hypothetical protein
MQQVEVEELMENGLDPEDRGGVMVEMLEVLVQEEVVDQLMDRLQDNTQLVMDQQTPEEVEVEVDGMSMDLDFSLEDLVDLE